MRARSFAGLPLVGLVFALTGCGGSAPRSEEPAEDEAEPETTLGETENAVREHRAAVRNATDELAAIQATFEAEVLPAARGCYERALQEDASLSGRLCLAFVVSADGAPAPVEGRCEGASPINIIRPCVMQAVMATRFPSNDRGAVSTFEQLYDFPMQAGPAD